jgi:peptidoglycan/xylan/chitin deacetylase (PgdA/CDA1 family)
MTVKELREFSMNQAIQVGNHTYSHEILTNLNSENDICAEITRNEQFLDRYQIEHIPAIAYPNGNYSTNVVVAARSVGMNWGYTTVAEKYNGNNLTIGRFSISGDLPIQNQAIWCVSNFKFYDTVRMFYQKCRHNLL